MAERGKRIQFQATVEFEGTVEEFKKVLAGFENLVDSGLKISTPENIAETMMIDTVPLPEGPFPGIFPYARLITVEQMMEQIGEMPRFALIDDIRGGIRNPHLHLGDDVVLLDRELFKSIVQETAANLTEELAENGDYVEIASAMRHLLSKGML
jgi:hypothetical protein